MKYNIIEEKNSIILKNIKDFIPKHIFECGQCFRWYREEDDSYTCIAHKKVINVKKEDNNLILKNTNINDFEYVWYNYFDLDKDYGEIKKILSSDSIMNKAIKFGSGIRILNQDEWEILISFIISANNRIPMIKRAVRTLSEKYGEYICDYKGKKFYSFPTPERLSRLEVEEIKACYTGFRAKYIRNAATIVANKEIDVYRMKNIDTTSARKELMLFSGIGPKVSDCIMLYSMQKYDAFPIDVWVKRVMEYFYVKEDTKLKDIQKYAQDKFGDYAGYAQQYLFYYARELGIRKTVKN